MSRAATRRTASAAAIALLLGGAFRGAGQEPTILAGEAFTRTVLGMTFDVPARDRTTVNEVFAGVGWLPEGPDGKTVNPEAAFLLWRQREGGARRLRAVLLGLYDDVRWNRRIGRDTDLVLTFENTTLPWARSEYAGGERLESEELTWGSLRAGAGLAFRRSLAPGHADNSFEASLAYEPGFLYFSKNSSAAAPSFVAPSDAYEGPPARSGSAPTPSRGTSSSFPTPDGRPGSTRGRRIGRGGRTGAEARRDAHAAASTRSWTALSGFALAALPLPVGDRRHRVLAAVYAGTGSDLDRFSAFRLSGGSNAGDYETITRPVLPAAGLDEIVSRGYVIASLEVRAQLAFFLFLHLKGTLASARPDRPRRVGRADPAHRQPERGHGRPHERVLLVLGDRALLFAQRRAREPERRQVLGRPRRRLRLVYQDLLTNCPFGGQADRIVPVT